MSDLNPTRPLPWKAVSYGGDDPSNRIWDVVNDYGDPREEFSVLEYATEGEARFIVRACNSHADLLAACDKALGYVKYTLEFFDWSRFPNLREEAEVLERQLTEAKAKGDANE